MKKFHSDKGFTMVEILTVLVIISILFATLIPQVNSYFIKSQEVGVKADFRDFQIASETYLGDVFGKNPDLMELNYYVDSVHEIIENDVFFETKSQDPWGGNYRVEVGNQKIAFSSFGKERDQNQKKYISATYYYKGMVSSCTSGFVTWNIKLNESIIVPDDFKCGDDLSASTLPPSETLDAPSNFKAENVTNTKAELSWNSVPSATIYVLKRNGITIYAGSNTQFTDMTLNPGATYTFTVEARNSATKSSQATLQVTTDSRPLAPTGFMATNITSTSAALFWNPSMNATTYVLSRDGLVVYSGSNTYFSDAGLKDYTDYSYSLFAQNSSGKSESVPLHVKTLANEETIKLPDIGTGSCTPYNPYIITTVGELQGINLDLNACYELGKNINASYTNSWYGGLGFKPIGNVAADRYFSGKLDGKNYSIDKLYINRPNDSNVGMFMGITNNALIQNMTINQANMFGNHNASVLVGGNGGVITNIKVNGSLTGENNIGGVVGVNSGRLDTIVSEVKVTGDQAVGGIVGINNGEMHNAQFLSTNEITGTICLGGVIGSNYTNGILINTTSKATVKGGAGVGGVIGCNNGTVNNASSTSNVIGWWEEIGGIAGYNGGDITNSVSNATVSGGNRVGGVIGINEGSVKQAQSNAIVNGVYQEIGGIIGYNDGILEDSVAEEGTIVTADNYLGGIIGYNGFSASLKNATSKATVSGVRDVGGVVGVNDGLIEQVISMSKVSGIDYSIGGVVGCNHGPITNAIITKEAETVGDATNSSYVGSIVGLNFSSVENVINSSKVSGYQYVGGVIGYNYEGDIQNVTSEKEAIVSGYNSIGGIIGYMESGSLTKTTSKAAVSGMITIGGVIGDNYGTVAQVVSDALVTGTQENIGGVTGYNQGTVIDVTVTNAAEINGNPTTSIYVGGVAGLNVGLIDNVTNSSKVTGYWYVGGVVGDNFEGEVNNITSEKEATVSGKRFVGGIVGLNVWATLKNLDSKATVSGKSEIGGVIGENYSTVEQVVSTAKVTGTEGYIGGAFGYNSGAVKNIKAESGTTVSGDLYVGGIIGYNDGEVSNAMATAEAKIIGELYIGGIIGVNFGKLNIADSEASVSGNEEVAGIVGTNYGEIINVNSSSKVTGEIGMIGGIVGYNGQDSAISNASSSNIAEVKGDWDVGGIIGRNDGILQKAISRATVIGRQSVGGAIGYSGESDGKVSEIFVASEAKVEGDEQIGGIIGMNYQNSTITNTFTAAKIVGNNRVGGIVGFNYKGTIKNSISVGNIIGANNFGGVVGLRVDGIIDSTYYDRTTTGQNDTGKGTGKTTVEMKNQSTYVDWDFNNLWGIDPAINDGYPYLKNLPN